MSQFWVNNEFTAGTVDGTGLVPNECGAVDIIASAVYEILAADSKLAGLFKVARYEAPPLVYNANTRLLAVSPFGLIEARGPGERSDTEIEVFVTLQWAQRDMDNLASWQPSVATVIDHAKNLLLKRPNHQLPVTAASETVNLAERALAGSNSLLPPEPIDGDELFVMLRAQFSILYRVTLDADRKITDLARALA